MYCKIVNDILHKDNDWYANKWKRTYAKKCKGKVPNKTYEAMMNWVVQIAD